MAARPGNFAWGPRGDSIAVVVGKGPAGLLLGLIHDLAGIRKLNQTRKAGFISGIKIIPCPQLGGRILLAMHKKGALYSLDKGLRDITLNYVGLKLFGKRIIPLLKLEYRLHRKCPYPKNYHDRLR